MTIQQAHEFWQYSLSHYVKPGVKTLCLRLQDDYQLNVNLLLLCGYLDQQNMQLNNQAFETLVTAIEETEQQLHSMRGKRKQAAEQADYALLLQQELEVEKAQQQCLINTLDSLQLSHQQADNLPAYVRSQKADMPSGLKELVDDLRQKLA